jgi:hypothetical protein
MLAESECVQLWHEFPKPFLELGAELCGYSCPEVLHKELTPGLPWVPESTDAQVPYTKWHSICLEPVLASHLYATSPFQCNWGTMQIVVTLYII